MKTTDSFICPSAPPRALSQPADNTWLCRYRAISKSAIDLEREQNGPAYLVMVHHIEPWNNMGKETGISRVTGGNALEVFWELWFAVEWLPLLDLVDHFAHILFDLACVFCEAVEAVYLIGVLVIEEYFTDSGVMEHTYRSLVENVNASENTNCSCQAHHRCESSLSDVRRTELFHKPEGERGGSCGGTSDSVVWSSSITEDSLNMST